MATASFLKMNSASGSSVTSVTVSSVSMTAGRRIVVGIGIVDPFDAATASAVSVQGASASIDIGLKGSGSPYNWLYTAFWSMTVNTTSTASVVVTLDKALGGSSQCLVIVNEVSNFDTSSPVGASTSSQVNSATASVTASTSTSDVFLQLVNWGFGVNDRWLQVQTGSGTISLFNGSPRPGSTADLQIACGYNTASGASTSLAWEHWGFDAGPIQVATEAITVGAVYKNASGGGSTASAFFVYSRTITTAGAIT